MLRTDSFGNANARVGHISVITEEPTSLMAGFMDNVLKSVEEMPVERNGCDSSKIPEHCSITHGVKAPSLVHSVLKRRDSKESIDSSGSPTKNTKKSNRHVSFSASPSIYPVENLSEYNSYPVSYDRIPVPLDHPATNVTEPSSYTKDATPNVSQPCIKSKAVMSFMPTTATTAVVLPEGYRSAERVAAVHARAIKDNSEIIIRNKLLYNDLPKTSLSYEVRNDYISESDSRIDTIKQRLQRRMPKSNDETSSNSSRRSSSDSTQTNSSQGEDFETDLTESKRQQSLPPHDSPARVASKLVPPKSVASSRGAIAALARAPKTKVMKVVPISSRIRIAAPKVRFPASKLVSPLSESLSLPLSGFNRAMYAQQKLNLASKNQTTVLQYADCNKSTKKHIRVTTLPEEVSFNKNPHTAIIRSDSLEINSFSTDSSPSIDSLETLLSKVNVTSEDLDNFTIGHGLSCQAFNTMSNDVSMESIRVSSSEDEFTAALSSNYSSVVNPSEIAPPETPSTESECAYMEISNTCALEEPNGNLLSSHLATDLVITEEDLSDLNVPNLNVTNLNINKFNENKLNVNNLNETNVNVNKLSQNRDHIFVVPETQAKNYEHLHIAVVTETLTEKVEHSHISTVPETLPKKDENSHLSNVPEILTKNYENSHISSVPETLAKNCENSHISSVPETLAKKCENSHISGVPETLVKNYEDSHISVVRESSARNGEDSDSSTSDCFVEAPSPSEVPDLGSNGRPCLAAFDGDSNVKRLSATLSDVGYSTDQSNTIESVDTTEPNKVSGTNGVENVSPDSLKDSDDKSEVSFCSALSPNDPIYVIDTLAAKESSSRQDESQMVESFDQLSESTTASENKDSTTVDEELDDTFTLFNDANSLSATDSLGSTDKDNTLQPSQSYKYVSSDDCCLHHELSSLESDIAIGSIDDESLVSGDQLSECTECDAVELSYDDDDEAVTTSPLEKVSNIITLFNKTSDGFVVTKKARSGSSIPLFLRKPQPAIPDLESASVDADEASKTNSLLRYKSKKVFSNRKAMFEQLEKADVSSKIKQPGINAHTNNRSPGKPGVNSASRIKVQRSIKDELKEMEDIHVFDPTKSPLIKSRYRKMNPYRDESARKNNGEEYEVSLRSKTSVIGSVESAQREFYRSSLEIKFQDANFSNESDSAEKNRLSRVPQLHRRPVPVSAKAEPVAEDSEMPLVDCGLNELLKQLHQGQLDLEDMSLKAKQKHRESTKSKQRKLPKVKKLISRFEKP